MPGPVVAHDDAHAAVALLDADGHRPARGRELDRVGQEVPDHLLQAVGIAGDRPRARLEQELQADPLRARRRGSPSRPPPSTTAVRSRARDVQAQLAGDDAGDVEHVLDELGLRPGVAVDDGHRAGRGVGLQVALHQQRGPAHDGVQRRAQLVGQRGQELVLQPVRVLGLAEQPGRAPRRAARARPGCGAARRRGAAARRASR